MNTPLESADLTKSQHEHLPRLSVTTRPLGTSIDMGRAESTLESVRRYLAKCPPAISGQGGDRMTFRIAVSLVHHFNLAEADALDVMQDWNERCVPPWSDSELQHKLRSAASPAPSKHSQPSLFGGGDPNRGRKPSKPVFRPMVLKRIAGNVTGVSDINEFLKAASPVPVAGLDSVGVLRLLYPSGSGERIVIFSVMKSQGQLVWSADTGDGVRNEELPSGPDGVWFLPQPVTGKYHANPRMDGKSSRRSEEAVTAWRYAVLESDQADAGDWLRCLVQLPLRIACVCESGGRSIHALARIDATSKQDWDGKIATIKPVLVTLGADAAALTAVRLTRLPQAMRGGRCQRLLYLNPNPNGTPIFGVSTNSKGLL